MTLRLLDLIMLQVLARGAGSEAGAPAGSGTQGGAHLGRVPGRRSTQHHQPGLAQLRTDQPKPEGPRTIQL